MISSELEAYIEFHTTGEDEILAGLNRETHLKVLNPRMLSGKIQGKFLEIISKIIAPTNILEIGTYTAYSSICLARGLRKGGKLYTIDYNDELVTIQKKYIQKAALSDKIELLSGNAIEIIPTLNVDFDLVFIDADKKSYIKFYNLVIEKVKQGGVILADNVLWSRKVIDENSLSDPDTKALMDFNEMVKNDTRVEVVILPLRDGISLIRKL